MKITMRLLFLATVALANLDDSSVTDSIDRYHTLLQKGAISQEHFNQVRDKILGNAMEPEKTHRSLSDSKDPKKCLASQVAENSRNARACGDVTENNTNPAVAGIISYLTGGDMVSQRNLPWCKPDWTISKKGGSWLWLPAEAGQFQYGKCKYGSQYDDEVIQKRRCRAVRDPDTGRISAEWGEVDTSACKVPCAALGDDLGAIELGDCMKQLNPGESCKVTCIAGETKGATSILRCPIDNEDPTNVPVGDLPKCLYNCQGGLPFEPTKEQIPDEDCKSVPYGKYCTVRCVGKKKGQISLRCKKENDGINTVLEGPKKWDCGSDFEYEHTPTRVPRKSLDGSEAALLESYLAQRGYGGKQWKGCYGWAPGSCSSSTCYSNYHKQCDNKGPMVTIVWTSNGAIFGAFSVLGARSSGSYVNTTENKKNNFLFRIKSVAAAQSGGVGSWGSCSGNCDYFSSSYGPTMGGGHDFTFYGSSWGTWYANPSNYAFRRKNNYYLSESTSTTNYSPNQSIRGIRFVCYTIEKYD